MSQDAREERYTIPARPVAVIERKFCDHPARHPWMKPRADWFVDLKNIPERFGWLPVLYLCDDCFAEFSEQFCDGAVLFWGNTPS